MSGRVGLDWISLTSLSTRSPYGDKNQLFHSRSKRPQHQLLFCFAQVDISCYCSIIEILTDCSEPGALQGKEVLSELKWHFGKKNIERVFFDPTFDLNAAAQARFKLLTFVQEVLFFGGKDICIVISNICSMEGKIRNCACEQNPHFPKTIATNLFSHLRCVTKSNNNHNIIKIQTQNLIIEGVNK